MTTSANCLDEQGEKLSGEKAARETSLLSANRIALPSLGLGLSADLLFYDGMPVGPGFTLWLVLLGSVVWVLLANRPLQQRNLIAMYAGLAIAASLLLLLRNTPLLALGMWLVIITAGAMSLLLAANNNLLRTTVTQQLAALGKLPLQAVFGFFPFLQRLQILTGVGNPRVRGIVRGLFLVTPLLVVFIALFASADAVVDRLAQAVIEELSANLLQHLLTMTVFAWLTAGMLAGLVSSAQSGLSFVSTPTSMSTARHWLRLGDEELLVILGLVTLLFIAFVLLQASYLFGGRETIESTTGLSLAEYARRGFFEMLVVAGLTLVLLLCVRSANPNMKLFKPFASMLTVCVIVMVVSAGQRLGIYIEEFGLSIDRITASTVMLWLVFCLVLFAVMTYKESNRGLALGMSHAGVLSVFMLAVLNPAAAVTEINLNRVVVNNKTLDAEYLVTLGSDAVPVLLQRLDEIEAEARCVIAVKLLQRWSGPAAGTTESSREGWRNWNWSKAKAFRLVEEHAQHLRNALVEARCVMPGVF